MTRSRGFIPTDTRLKPLLLEPVQFTQIGLEIASSLSS